MKPWSKLQWELTRHCVLIVEAQPTETSISRTLRHCSRRVIWKLLDFSNPHSAGGTAARTRPAEYADAATCGPE